MQTGAVFLNEGMRMKSDGILLRIYWTFSLSR